MGFGESEGKDPSGEGGKIKGDRYGEANPLRGGIRGQGTERILCEKSEMSRLWGRNLFGRGSFGGGLGQDKTRVRVVFS